MGLWLSVLRANRALARTKSSTPRKLVALRSAGIVGRSWSVSRVSIRMISRFSMYSKSRISLLISRASSGSINTVCPVADSSWIKPRSLRLFSAAIGITILPPRIVIAASSGIRPLARASLNIRSITFLSRPSSYRIWVRINCNSLEALLLSLPFSSSTWSITWSSLRSRSIKRPNNAFSVG